MAEEETAIFKLYKNFHEQTIEKTWKGVCCIYDGWFFL